MEDVGEQVQDPKPELVRLSEHPILEKTAPYFNFQVYDRDGGTSSPRIRIEFRSKGTPQEIIDEVLQVQTACVRCKKPIFSFRKRAEKEGGAGRVKGLNGGIYVAVSCPRKVNAGCCNGAEADLEYVDILNRVCAILGVDPATYTAKRRSNGRSRSKKTTHEEASQQTEPLPFKMVDSPPQSPSAEEMLDKILAKGIGYPKCPSCDGFDWGPGCNEKKPEKFYLCKSCGYDFAASFLVATVPCRMKGCSCRICGTPEGTFICLTCREDCGSAQPPKDCKTCEEPDKPLACRGCGGDEQPTCCAPNPLHPGAGCQLPTGHGTDHRNGTSEWSSNPGISEDQCSTCGEPLGSQSVRAKTCSNAFHMVPGVPAEEQPDQAQKSVPEAKATCGQCSLRAKYDKCERSYWTEGMPHLADENSPACGSFVAREVKKEQPPASPSGDKCEQCAFSTPGYQCLHAHLNRCHPPNYKHFQPRAAGATPVDQRCPDCVRWDSSANGCVFGLDKAVGPSPACALFRKRSVLDDESAAWAAWSKNTPRCVASPPRAPAPQRKPDGAKCFRCAHYPESGWCGIKNEHRMPGFDACDDFLCSHCGYRPPFQPAPATAPAPPPVHPPRGRRCGYFYRIQGNPALTPMRCCLDIRHFGHHQYRDPDGSLLMEWPDSDPNCGSIPWGEHEAVQDFLREYRKLTEPPLLPLVGSTWRVRPNAPLSPDAVRTCRVVQATGPTVKSMRFPAQVVIAYPGSFGGEYSHTMSLEQFLEVFELENKP